jgi:3-deoxy-D-manno-octulosonic-acid transferase
MRKTIWYPLYSFLLFVAAILSSPYWIYKALTTDKYHGNFRQRLGCDLPQWSTPTKPFWIHAVSVGEVLAAKSIVSALRTSRPDLPLVISTVTLTGQATAQKEFKTAAGIFYFPFDFAFSVNRFLKHLNPRGVLLMETELWPNFIDRCRRRGVPLFLANGRISNQSFRRYRRIKLLVRDMLHSMAAIGAQTKDDAERFLELGAIEKRVQITGNLKFDYALPTKEAQSEWIDLIRASLGYESGGYVIVAGSTMKGEESIILDAFQKILSAIPQARLILAPRHPERFDEVADLACQSGSKFLRRSQLGRGTQDAEILLLDTMGELRAVYSLASVAVIGGSFLPFGGHNPLEPAALRKAIVFGPEMSNFKEISDLFVRESAACRCSANDLPRVLIDLLKDREKQNALGERAYDTLRRNQGATVATLNLLLPYIP